MDNTKRFSLLSKYLRVRKLLKEDMSDNIRRILERAKRELREEILSD